MSDLHTATIIADADLADNVELPARLSGATGLLRITLAKIKLYLSTALVLVPAGGAAGDVLTKVSGTDYDVHWAAPSGGGGGGMATLLDTQVAAGAASVIFDDTKITATYKTYELRFEGFTPSAAGTFVVQVSPDNGVTWRTAGYISARDVWGISTNFANYAQALVTNGLLLIGDSNTDAARTQNGSAILYNLLSATQCDTIQGNHLGKSSDGNIYDFRNSGMYTTAAEAHNAIRIVPSAGAPTFSGTFKLYGIT